MQKRKCAKILANVKRERETYHALPLKSPSHSTRKSRLTMCYRPLTFPEIGISRLTMCYRSISRVELRKSRLTMCHRPPFLPRKSLNRDLPCATAFILQLRYCTDRTQNHNLRAETSKRSHLNCKKMRKHAKTQKIFENRPTFYLLWAAFLNGRYNMVSHKSQKAGSRSSTIYATLPQNIEFP